MTNPILATKLYIPPLRPKIVWRPNLIEKLNAGLAAGCRLTLISASAGFGKTTLLSEWIAALTPGPSPGGRGEEHLTPGPSPEEREGSEVSPDHSPFGRGEEQLFPVPSPFGRPVPRHAGGEGVRVAWLSLEEGDSDLTRFLNCFMAALQRIHSDVGTKVLEVLQSPQPPPIEALLTDLVNEISSLPDPFIIVLDDYHVINSTPVNRALGFLLEHLPLQLHLVIATREDPPLPLARLRARGQLTELRAADLRFTSAEVEEFLHQMGINLSAQDIAALEARTEGWITGLQLAALSMQGRDDVAAFIQAFTGSHRFVLDYLVEEVLLQQSENIQSFLLCTSILRRLCGPLCETVTGYHADSWEVPGQQSSQEILEQLERANLFVVPLDNSRDWYRYHHLFGEILRQRLEKKYSTTEIAAIHLRASQWFERNGDQAEAFQHAFAAGDFGRAAGLAESAWEEMNGTFQSAAWLGWVQQLPEAEIRQRPVLSTQMGLAYMDLGEPEASETRLQEAERCLNDPGGGMIVVEKGQLKTLPAMIAMARAYNAQVQGNLSDTVKYAELALQLIPEDDFFRRAQATVTLQFTYCASGDLDRARAALGEFIDSMQKAGNFTFAVASAFVVADILVELGQLREAINYLQQSLRLAAAHGRETQKVTAHHHLGLAMIYHEMGEEARASDHLENARELGEQTTLVDWPYRWHIAQARLKESRGELEAALHLLEEASRVYVKNPVPDTRPIEALKASLYLKQGRLQEAQRWVQQRGLSPVDATSYLNEFEHLILARVLIAEHPDSRPGRSLSQVIAMLQHIQERAEEQKRTGSLIEILITLSLAYQAQENLTKARDTLGQALELAEPEGYLRIFLDKGKPVQTLLRERRNWIDRNPGVSNHPLREYIEKLLSFSERTGAQPPGASQGEPELIEPLSEREQEVLRLIAQGLSNHAISQRLFLAESTIKGHNQRIFGKLQVGSRTEAVQRGRELGLL